jgi:hypothetical protein
MPPPVRTMTPVMPMSIEPMWTPAFTFDRILENIKAVIILGIIGLIVIVIVIVSIAKAISGFENDRLDEEQTI